MTNCSQEETDEFFPNERLEPLGHFDGCWQIHMECAKKEILRLQIVDHVVRSLAFENLTEMIGYEGQFEEGHITVDCSDVFEWGTADSEPVETWSDVGLLDSCISHASNCGFPIMATALYAVRKREGKPMDQILNGGGGVVFQGFC